MELVYLWIEDYKNIKRQGFTFSPKFDCKYDPETNTLEIKEKKDYVNIFPDNINVTAIVGKNGAGKSSVLEFLNKILNINDQNDIKKYILIYFEKNQLYIYLNFKINKMKVKNYTSHQLNFNFKKLISRFRLYFLNQYNNSFINIEEKYNLYSDWNEIAFKSKFARERFHLSLCKLRENFYIFLMYILTLNINFVQYNKFFNPKKIKIKISNEEIFFNKIHQNELNIKKLESNNIEDFFNLFFERLIESNNFKKFKPEIFSKLIDKDRIKKKLKKTLIELKDKVTFFYPIDKYKNVDCSTDVGELFLSYNKYKYTEISISLENVNNIVEINQIIKFIKYIKDLFFLLDIPYGYEIDVEGVFNHKLLSFNELSDGEKDFCLIYSTFFYYEKEERCNMIFFDDIFGSYHPNWQKKFLINLINNFIELKDNNPFHIILTTHSPFILSDIPKENIIFMKDGKNVSNDVHIQTFGANIHTLLTHGFFMEDGLMGEYAKSKIDEVIKYLNNEESKIASDEEAQKITNIIGEPIIKKELQRKLDSKKLNKINEIEEKITILKERLEILRKNS